MVRVMKNTNTIKRITKNAIMLAMLCVIGMFSLPLGDNIKVSLQLLMVFIIGLTVATFYDGMIITGLYLLLGLVAPIYAGFSVGVTPTFGFVISFVVITPIIYFLNKLPIKNDFLRMSIACIVSLIACYFIGALFLALYLHLNIQKALLIAVVPYVPFDIAKIVIGILVVSILNKRTN